MNQTVFEALFHKMKLQPTILLKSDSNTNAGTYVNFCQFCEFFWVARFGHIYWRNP